METDKACDNVSRLLSESLYELIIAPIAFVSRQDEDEQDEVKQVCKEHLRRWTCKKDKEKGRPHEVFILCPDIQFVDFLPLLKIGCPFLIFEYHLEVGAEKGKQRKNQHIVDYPVLEVVLQRYQGHVQDKLSC